VREGERGRGSAPVRDDGHESANEEVNEERQILDGHERDHHLDARGGARQSGEVQEIVRRLQPGRTQISGTILSVFLGPPRDAHTFPAQTVVLSFLRMLPYAEMSAGSMFIFFMLPENTSCGV
jgi:hypothetical protein